MDMETQIPLTDDELREVQITVSSKIFRINHEREQGKITEDQAARSLKTLSKVAEKCACARYANQS